ncbi:hypothetical protein, partial [[Ruminococcus] torques]|uniref:hypothetical protein n=1 Tax=[Ruminococcus] torques TaxID=33039 RepID=UPI003AB7C7A0
PAYRQKRFHSKIKHTLSPLYFSTVQPYSVREAENMPACFCERTSVCGERPFMSKTVAAATISTQCGFTNGAD